MQESGNLWTKSCSWRDSTGEVRLPASDILRHGRQCRQMSLFHGALSRPQVLRGGKGDHRERVRKLGVSPGSDTMIHGIGNGLCWLASMHHVIGWTDGCIAVTEAEIEEI